MPVSRPVSVSTSEVPKSTPVAPNSIPVVPASQSPSTPVVLMSQSPSTPVVPKSQSPSTPVVTKSQSPSTPAAPANTGTPANGQVVGSCTIPGAMSCYGAGTNGFVTCANGQLIYRNCGPGTTCQTGPGNGVLFCGYP
jgi:hypothetical protein